MRASCAALIAIAVLLFHALGPAAAITIQVEYLPGTLFSVANDAQAKLAIEAAASDLSTAITSTLNSIPTDAFNGSFGGTAANLGFQFNYLDPQTGNATVESLAIVPGNTVRVRVGTRNLTGSTRGEAGPAVLTFDNSQLTGGGPPGQWSTAVSFASATAASAYSRGGGPTIGQMSGSVTYGGTTAPVDFSYGPLFGSLALDNDAAIWHFDHTTPVGVTKTDLYSVALHEMLHILGFGISDSWSSLVSGTNWLGTEVIAHYGTGTGLLASPSSHLKHGLMSQSIVDGTDQEVAMDPNIVTQQRKYLTTLDLAFLRDLGYQTIAPVFGNLAGDFDNDGDVDAADLQRWQNAYALNANADADNDGDSDGADFLIWQRNRGTSSFSAVGAAVPEPSVLVLLTTAVPWLVARGRPLRGR